MTASFSSDAPKGRSGLSYLIRGARLVASPGLRRYAVMPVVVNCVIFTLVFVLGYGALDGLFDRFLPDADGLLGGALRTVAWLLVIVFGGALIFFGFTALANILGAPFNAMLSQAVERRLDGAGASGVAIGDTVKGFARIMLNETRKVIYFALTGLIVWILPMLISSVIPGLNVLVGSALSLLFLAWMNAVEYIDYPMSQRNVAFKSVRKTVASRRGLCLGFGGAVVLMMSIPLLNLVAMPVAVAGATALWHDHFRA